MTKIFALGASDVEMSRIESLLGQAGFEAVYAAHGGVRCHPGNAYKCDSFVSPNGETVDLSDYPEIIRVECDGPAFAGLATKVVVVDHHRQGDPGFGLPPQEFLRASSIGQVLRHIGIQVRYCPVDGWCTAIPAGYPAAVHNYEPDSWAMVASADHCLEAAYRGQCPGVDPYELMKSRAEARAKFRGVPVEQVLQEIESARERLLNATSAHHSYIRSSGVYIADLRGQGEIPELPEAACREGIPFLADATDPPRGGLPSRAKVVLMAVPQGTGLVEKFMSGELVPGLGEFYGDPARGFAGGYPQ